MALRTVADLQRWLATAGVLSLLVVFCGQSTAQAQSPNVPMQRVLDSWIGKPLARLIAIKGEPNNWLSLANGGRVVEYDDSYDVVIRVPVQRQDLVAPQDNGPDLFAGVPGGSGAYGLLPITPPTNSPALAFNAGTDYVARRVRRTCFRDFFSDPNGIIVRWNQDGNGC